MQRETERERGDYIINTIRQNRFLSQKGYKKMDSIH